MKNLWAFAVAWTLAAPAGAETVSFEAGLERGRLELAAMNPFQCRMTLLEPRSERGRLILKYREIKEKAERLRASIERNEMLRGAGLFRGTLDGRIEAAKRELALAEAELRELEAEARSKGVDVEKDRLTSADYDRHCIRDRQL